jgi:MarR family transcriptional regulator for hemolysin
MSVESGRVVDALNLEVDPYEALGRAIGLAQRRWAALFNDRMSVSGHTNLRWMALSRVSESSGGISQRDLSKLLGADAPTLARLIDALASQGLIERVADSRDRRVKLLRITEAAVPALREGAVVGRVLRASVFEGIPDQDVEVAERVLIQICERLNQLAR